MIGPSAHSPIKLSGNALWAPYFIGHIFAQALLTLVKMRQMMRVPGESAMFRAHYLQNATHVAKQIRLNPHCLPEEQHRITHALEVIGNTASDIHCEMMQEAISTYLIKGKGGFDLSEQLVFFSHLSFCANCQKNLLQIARENQNALRPPANTLLEPLFKEDPLHPFDSLDKPPS